MRRHEDEGQFDRPALLERRWMQLTPVGLIVFVCMCRAVPTFVTIIPTLPSTLNCHHNRIPPCCLMHRRWKGPFAVGLFHCPAVLLRPVATHGRSKCVALGLQPFKNPRTHVSVYHAREGHVMSEVSRPNKCLLSPYSPLGSFTGSGASGAKARRNGPLSWGCQRCPATFCPVAWCVSAPDKPQTPNHSV